MQVLYSCVTGDVDDPTGLMNSVPPQPGLQCCLFTDRRDLAAPPHWAVLPLAWRHPLSPRRTARYHKINSHLLFPAAEATWWLDGNLQCRDGIDLLAIAAAFTPGFDLAVPQHPLRNCIYQEYQACRELRKDDPATMWEQLSRYWAAGHPAYAGLAETNLLWRRNTPAMTRFNQIWWVELAAGSLRDQLSFPFVARSLKQQYLALPHCHSEAAYCRLQPHAAEQS